MHTRVKLKNLNLRESYSLLIKNTSLSKIQKNTYILLKVLFISKLKYFLIHLLLLIDIISVTSLAKDSVTAGAIFVYGNSKL